MNSLRALQAELRRLIIGAVQQEVGLTARLYYTSADVGSEPIGELAVVKLVDGMDIETLGRLPEGSLGAVVFVHDEGKAYEIEFTEPFAAVVTLRRDEIEPTETTRASVQMPSAFIIGVANAVGVHHRRR